MFSTLAHSGVNLETLLAAGYATLLPLVALGLEHLAARSHRRAEDTTTASFRYDRLLDHWECPTGTLLHPAEVDQVRGLVRYRARPTACNRCPLKTRCTDDDSGREVVRSLDPWPQSEIARFHRGISLLLLGLAGLIVVVGLLRHHTDPDLILLGSNLLVTAAMIQRLLPGFFAERSLRNAEPGRDWHGRVG